MLQHNDRIEAPGDLADLEAEMNRTNLVPFGLYDAIINSVAVAVDPRAGELAAEQLKTWFLRHHSQEAQRLNHIPMDT